MSDLSTRSELHIAILDGSFERVQALVNDGADINSENDVGKTPLMIAADNNHPDIVEFLISAGANINCCDEYKWTLLHHASCKGWLSISRSLIEKGIDVNAKNINGESALISAAEFNNPDIVELLVNAGSDTDCSNQCGWTLLHFAAWGGWLANAPYLLEKGLDIDAETKLGEGSMVLAFQNQHWDALKLLVDASWYEMFGNAGDSFLTYLIKNTNKDSAIVKSLFEKGANLTSEEYNLMLEKPLFKKDILQDIELCSQVIIDKFNNKDLPRLYKLAKSTTNLPQIDKMKINSGSKVAEDVMQTVIHEIKGRGHCNILEARPIVLSMLAVKSFIDYCHDVKESRDALQLAQNSELQKDLKRNSDEDYPDGLSKKICLN